MHINIEIKARCADPEKIRQILRNNNADFRGTDHQTDTYFGVRSGRLKLREGNIENALIFYRRDDEAGPAQSDVALYESKDAQTLKAMLTEAIGIKMIVRKQREIYFIDNVKFHIDIVEGLGSFVEIEAIDVHAAYGVAKLRRQCDQYMRLLGIAEADLIAKSYSDMLKS